MTITQKEVFEYEGKTVSEFTLIGDGLSVCVLNFGGIIKSINVETKSGIRDVALGYDDAKDYLKDGCFFGATVGRVCNRIENAEFVLNGEKYILDKNDGKNSLHGGFSGFYNRVFDAEIKEDKLVLSYFSKEGEGGYPANLKVRVEFSVNGKKLSIAYYAESDADTPVSLTNHSYFNLGTDPIKTSVYIDADRITPVDETLIPKGFKAVDGTPFDFRKFKVMGKDIDADDQNIKFCGGYDINYCLNGKGFRKVAAAKSDDLVMNVYTDCDGMQFYSGNFLNGVKGKGGKSYARRSGFCFETQGYPNAVNDKNYPSITLKAGEKFSSRTVYEFENI